VDLLVNTVNETRNGPPLLGTLVGVAKGAGCSSLRLLSGAVDVTTFWVPGFNGFPVSDSYDNCLAVSPAGVSQMGLPPGSPVGETHWEEPAAQPAKTSPAKAKPPRYTK